MSESFVPFMDGPDTLSVPCIITDIGPRRTNDILVTFQQGCELVSLLTGKELRIVWFCPRKDVTVLEQSPVGEGLRATVKLRLKKELPDGWLAVLMDRGTERIIKVPKPAETLAA